VKANPSIRYRLASLIDGAGQNNNLVQLLLGERQPIDQPWIEFLLQTHVEWHVLERGRWVNEEAFGRHDSGQRSGDVQRCIQVGPPHVPPVHEPCRQNLVCWEPDLHDPITIVRTAHEVKPDALNGQPDQRLI